MNTETETKQQERCPYCSKPIETPVVRKIIQRRNDMPRGIWEHDVTFCSRDCGGYYQMGCEG
jgi:uncharacterized protein with PIN domain